MTVQQILQELQSLGSASIKKVLSNHGVREPFFGVRVGDLKKIQKRIKHDYQLALDLFATGNYDAMYLAGLIADDQRMTKADLNRWVKSAYGSGLPTVVAWVAAESPHGWELAVQWIESKSEATAVTGWSTLSSVVSITDDEDLDMDALRRLVLRVQQSIHDQPNFVRYAMNSFVIAVGIYVRPLTPSAISAAKKIGTVSVDMGATACQVPSAIEYLQKAQMRNSIGKKRKTAKC